MRQAGSTRKDCDIQTCSIPLTKGMPEAHPVGWGCVIGNSLRAICNAMHKRTILHRSFDEKPRRFDKKHRSLSDRQIAVPAIRSCGHNPRLLLWVVVGGFSE